MIGYLGLARETFDVPFAMSKFLEGKKVLRNIFTEIKGIDFLITNNELSDKAFKYFKDKIDLTKKLNNEIEKMILKNPNEWIWSHNRWK